MTGDELKSARASLGLTQAALAAILTIRIDKLKTWESGKHKVSDEGAEAIRWLLAGKTPI